MNKQDKTKILCSKNFDFIVKSSSVQEEFAIKSNILLHNILVLSCLFTWISDITRWIFSDCHLFCLFLNGQLVKDFRKILVDILVEECSENINEKELHPNKMSYNSTLNDYEWKNMQFLYNIHSVACYIFHNKYNH